MPPTAALLAAAGCRLARRGSRRLTRRCCSTQAAAALAPSFTATLNYTTADIIQLAQTDEAAAVQAFWQPLHDYRALMRSLGVRHAREELKLGDGSEFVASLATESAEQRKARLASFNAFLEALKARGDPDAAAVEAARRRSGGAHRQAVRVEVRDARHELSSEATLDATGFCLERLDATALYGATDAATAQARYQRAMQALVRARTGGSRVFCSPAKVRRTDGGQQAAVAGHAQRPLHGVHNDFGPTFASELVRGLQAHEESVAADAALPGPSLQAVTVGLCKQLRAAGVTAAELQASRVLMVNTWRSLHAAPVRRQPLALVDRRSVAAEDVAVIPMPAGVTSEFAVRLVYARPSAAHAWYWFSSMTPEEVLLFKQYDSAEPESCGMLHSAVHHPGTTPDSPPRHSYEMRMLCLLPGEKEAET